MELIVAEGSSNRELHESVLKALGIAKAPFELQRFPDGELQVEITGNVRDADVFVLQGTHPPVGEHLFELLLLADAFQRGGARRLTAVVPYVGYARQDRRSKGRESLGSKLFADLLGTHRFHRLVAVDLHTPAIEGFFSMPVEHLTAVSLLAEAARPSRRENAVVVAPDLGAVKLAERYASLLDLPLALVHKTRQTGSEVTAVGVVGDVRNKAPILVDDMVTTAGTLEAAAKVLLEHGASAEITAVVTHGLLVGTAVERLQKASVRRLITTDSVPGPEMRPGFEIRRCPLAPLLAETIRRLHDGRSLMDLISQR